MASRISPASVDLTPARDAGRRRAAVTLLVLAAAAVFSWRAVEADAGALFSPATRAALWRLTAGLFPPDLSPAFLTTVGAAALQTAAIAVAATILSLALGLPLSVLATGLLWRRGVLVEAQRPGTARTMLGVCSSLVRGLLGFIRAVPDLLWAILFVTMVGLGPLAGTLALGLAYSGVIGRVYAETFDGVDTGPLEALQASGASRLQIFLHGIWPQALAPLVAYTLYSFECAVRAASVLGLVGAGGLGYEIGLSMRMFEYGQVLTLVFAFVALLALTDAASRAARRWLAGHSRRLSAVEPEARRGPLPRIAATLLLVVTIPACFVWAGVTPAALAEEHMAGSAARFIGGMFPPDVSRRFLVSLARPLEQTIGIAFLGTLVGVVGGGLLSLPATASLTLADRQAAGRQRAVFRAARASLFWLARLTLNGLRAIPELVWVLACIVAIGVGPFAGSVAIGLHTAGVLGKLYAESMEEVPRRPLEALYALGARPLQVLARGIWPQARPMLRNYTWLRWEANLRVSTILGLVGGGGLGQAIYNDIQLGFYDRVTTMIAVIYLMVAASDAVSDRMRAGDATRVESLTW